MKQPPTLSLILPKRVAPGVVGLYLDSATFRAEKSQTFNVWVAMQ